MMSRLAEVIDAHKWDELSGRLHKDFVCVYVHTDERFGRDSWVRLNAEYPGFDHLVLQDCVATDERAAGRSHVTAATDGKIQHYEVDTFITVRDDLIVEMTEVWTDVAVVSPTS